MRATDMLGAEVVTEDGAKLGRVRDLRLRRAGDDWELRALALGGRGLLERLGVTRASAEEPFVDRDLVAWDAVVRIEAGQVVVRTGTTVD